MNNWIEQLLPIRNEYMDGNDEPMDGDDVDDLVKIIRAKLNLHEGNIDEKEYNKILDSKRGETGEEAIIVLTEVHTSDKKNITEEQKDQLVDLDLVWFDGGKWSFSHCKAFEDFFKK